MVIHTIIQINENTEIEKAKDKTSSAYIKVNKTPIGEPVHLVPLLNMMEEEDTILKKDRILLHPYEILVRPVKDWRNRGIVYVPKKYIGEKILIQPLE